MAGTRDILVICVVLLAAVSGVCIAESDAGLKQAAAYSKISKAVAVFDPSLDLDVSDDALVSSLVDVNSSSLHVPFDVWKSLGIFNLTQAVSIRSWFTSREQICNPASVALILRSGIEWYPCSFMCEDDDFLSKCHAAYVSGRFASKLGAGPSSRIALRGVKAQKRIDSIIMAVEETRTQTYVRVRELSLLFVATFLIAFIQNSYMHPVIKGFIAIVGAVTFAVDGLYIQMLLTFGLMFMLVSAKSFTAFERGSMGVSVLGPLFLLSISYINDMIALSFAGIFFMASITALVMTAFLKRSSSEFGAVCFIGLAVANCFTIYGRMIVYAEAINIVIAITFFILRAVTPFTSFDTGFYLYAITTVRECDSSAEIFSRLIGADGDKIFIALLVARPLLFYAARMLLGYATARRIQNLGGARLLLYSLLIPITDVFAPFNFLAALFGGRPARRRAGFEFINTFLFFTNVIYALDLYAFHVLAAIVMYVVDPVFGRVAHMLASTNADYDLNGFSHDGAMPWVSASRIDEIRMGVGKLHTVRGSGVGLAVKRNGNYFIETVQHMLRDTNEVTLFGTRVIASRDFDALGDYDDPAISIAVYSPSDEFMSRAVDVQHLTRGEMYDVHSLFLTSPRLEQDYADVVVSRFTFSPDASFINATVNLTYGDSGTPVFGILKTGAVRLAGFVSRGVREAGSGNVIASVIRSSSAKTSSPSTSSPQVPIIDTSFDEWLHADVKTLNHYYDLQRAQSKRKQSQAKRMKPEAKMVVERLVRYGHLSPDFAKLVDDEQKIYTFNYNRTSRQVVSSLVPVTASEPSGSKDGDM